MGCIKIDSFVEVEPFKRQNFGKNQDASVNVSQKPSEVFVNVNDIAQFENIEIKAERPNTDNKVDAIEGVRILTHTGNIYVVFADSEHTFDQAFDFACGGGSVVEYDRKKSDYLTRYKK